MGMTSKHVASKRVHPDCEEEEVRKRAKPSLELPSHKDDARFKSPASPAPIQLKADGASKRPAEVFRTDFITAMKVPDNHTLAPGRNYELVDTWRQEWEKGVQVPVNPDILPKIFCREKEGQVHEKRYDAFSMPQARISYDSPELLHTSDKTAGCLYDLDDLDVKWLQIMRNSGKKGSIDESMMEKVMTYFERKCFENMAHAVATKKGLSIEYDETTICDVCLSPDTEENNEIVFCDACNICVHQACYGIPDIPTGTWLCRPCSRGVLSPPCIICPNRGGAMKRIKGSFEWIHVICAWWVPEVKIEDTDNVEKMTVDKIPASRKNLCCLLCREKIGACIQCSVKRCVVAYHVTCAVKEGLEMKTVMMQDKDDVQHISYCKRHCVPQPSEKSKPRVGDNVENQRLQELQKLQEKFFKLVSVKKSARELRLTKDITSKLFGYWVLKRKANENRPLIPLTTEQQEKLSGKQGIFLIQEQINVEVERYSLLRQDLERLRNLCYLIIRRERVKKEVHKASQDVFNKQNDILESEQSTLSEEEFNKIASGNELMRFTKFPSYSMYGPPFADHLGEEGTAEDETNSSGACFTDGGTVGLNNSEPSCSYTSYTGDVAAVQPHTEASSSNTVSSGDGNESVDVTEVITMKVPDQQPPGNAMNDQGNTLEKLLTLNGIKKNLMEDAKEMASKSNLCPQNKAESSTETIANTDSIQNADNTKCKDIIKVVQKQTIDFGDGQSNFINAPSESPKIETKSSWKVDTLNCVASEKSCRTPKRGPKGNKGQSSAVKRVLRSSPRDIKGTLDVELPVKEDIISRLGNTDLRSSIGHAEDDTVKCLNVHNEVKKRLGLNDSHKGVSRRPPRRITRSCDRSINLDLCEADSSISQGQEHRNQKPNEFTENRDSRTNVGFDKQDSIAVDTQETANVHCSDTPGDSLSYSSVVTKLLEQSKVIEKVSTDVLNNSHLLIDKNLETNIDESSPVADIPNGKVDPDFKVGTDSNDNPDCKVDANCSINPDCKVDANCSINPDCKVDANCNINSDCKVDLETDQVENDNKDDELRSEKVDCLTSSSEPENATQAAFNIEKESRNDLSVMENRSLENREKCSNQNSSSEVCVQPDAKDTLSTETAVLETDISSGIKKCAQENIEDMKHQDLTSKVCSEPEVKDSTTIETGAPETDTSIRNVTETTRDHEGIIRENVDLKPASVSLSTEPEPEPSSTSQATTPVAESPPVDKPAAESPLVDTPAAESSHVDTPAAESSHVDTPAAKSPRVDTPAAESSFIDKLAAESPLVDTPAVESPLVDTPAAESPLVDTPAVESPLVDTPAVESPLVDKPAAESPLVDTPAVESPLVDTPAAESPLVDTPAVESPLVDTPAVESPLVDTPAAESPLVNALQLCFEQQALKDDETGTAEGSFNEEITDDFQTTTTISANHTIVNGHCSESSFSQKENDSPNNDTTTLPKIESSCTETKDGPVPALSRRLSFDIERRDETYLNDRNFFDRFMDSSKNPVVLLNELSGIERMKEDRPNDLNGLNSSPRKTKKISDAPSPAFPHTVIDDLIACPQRLTRGRTQLMMMDEHRSALSRRNRRKSHHFTNQRSDPDIPRLTRRRLRSFGLEKLDLINNDLMNEVGMTSSYSPRKRNIESDTKNTLNGNTELEDVFLKDVSKTSALEEITGSPTRLTRARVRSLGLGYGEG
eukprot:Seg2622.2 transcript_id=Seg2622.2/GoldUCD/mRNA.D3Y31 product="Protein Jade-3" protein_id=Seg2622.2/GoldUCD/D3Y31